MENQLLIKLQLKPGFKVKVINAPANLDEIMGTIPSGIEILSEGTDVQALLIFAVTRAELNNALSAAQQSIHEKTICWIIYPKAKSKIAADLNLMQSWQDLISYGLSPCGSAAINETWTAMRIKPQGEVKKSGLGNAEIKTGEFGEYINVADKKVTLPPDLKSTLEENPAALQHFEALSYSNKKEYVLWVLSAKQEKTRSERIAKTVDKLLAGRKNPSEKS